MPRKLTPLEQLMQQGQSPYTAMKQLNPLMGFLGPGSIKGEEDDLLNIASDLLSAITKGDKGTASKLAQTLEEAGQAGGNKVLQKPMAAAEKQLSGPSMEMAPKAGPSAQKLAKGARNEPRPPKAPATSGATTGVHANMPPWKNPETWMSPEEKAYKQDFPKLQQPTGKLEPSPAEMEAIKAGKMSMEDWLHDSYKNYKLGLEQHKVDMMRQNYELMRRLGLLAKKKYGE